MESLFSLSELVSKGGVYADVEGNTPEEVYTNLIKLINLPADCKKNEILSELIAREQVLSTAVGNGIAIPHPRRPMIKNEKDQRIIVCFPKNPLSMGAPDGRKVFAMFVILSHTTQFHLKSLSALAKVIKDDDFQKLLSEKPDSLTLLTEIKYKSN